MTDFNVEECKILEIKTGSHLYGTNTPESDEDYCGIIIPPKEYFLGLLKVEEVDLSIVDKHESGKNTKEAVDRKFYEIRNFVRLAMQNNPNIIEMLFVNADNIVYESHFGRRLLDIAVAFPYAGCYDRFIGYAVSQKKKMLIKRDNMESILRAEKILENFETKLLMADVEALLLDIPEFNIKGQHVIIGDMSIQRNNTVKEGLRKLRERSGKFSSRYDDYVSKYGYDTKFASHLIRLLLEGQELLKYGNIEFPLKEAELLLDIKKGGYTIDQVLSMAEDLENEMRDLKETTFLPKKPRFDEINKFLVNLVENALTE